MDLKPIAKEINELLEKRRKEIELKFVESRHTYFMKDENGKLRANYPSVSKLVKNFHPYFDADKKALEMCNGDMNKAKKLLAEWKLSGEISTNMGSRSHFLLEQDLVGRYDNYKDIRQPNFKCDEEQIRKSDQMVIAGKQYLDLMHERGAVLIDTEAILGDPELGYTGAPDKAWLMENKSKTNFGIVVTDWKGLPLDTPMLTNNGWKTMGTLTPQDNVFDKDGNLVAIKHFSKIKNKKCLKIKFDNGEEIVSDFEHRWLVFKKHNGKITEMVLTTQEIYDYYNNLGKRASNKLLKIKNAEPLNINNQELPIDPYVFGLWLGDGHKTCGMITQANKNIWDEIERRGYKIGNDVSQGGCGTAQSRTILNLRGKLRELNLLNNKHLPEKFLLSSYEQRSDILRGLMDSDGYFNKKRNRYIISTTKENQIKYSVELISSLGIKPTVLKYFKKINNKKIQCFNIEFTTDKINPFLCRNNDINIKIKKDKHSFRTIQSVTDTEIVPTICIEVDSPSNTFLCGRSLIVTHNTNQPKNFEVQVYTKKMYPPFEQYDDIALRHYCVQIPLYGKLMIKMLQGSKYENIKMLGGVIVLLKDNATFVEYKVPAEMVKTILTMDITKYTKK